MKRWGERLAAMFTRNWWTKLGALVLAAVLFVLTRDEVARTFEVPLQAVADPSRVLVTSLPSRVRVKVRGPWTRINRLQPYDFHPVHLDLSQQDPGPLEIDNSGLVMPSGVVLADVEYDHVDLRFDPVVDRSVAIEPRIEGAVHPDYHVARVTVEPARVTLQGGATSVHAVRAVETEVIDVAGAQADVVRQVSLLRPGRDIRWDGSTRAPLVDVIAHVRPLDTEIRIRRPVHAPKRVADETLPETVEVIVRGATPLVHDLRAHAEWIELNVRLDQQAKVAVFEAVWAHDAPANLRAALELEPSPATVTIEPSEASAQKVGPKRRPERKTTR